MQKSRCVLMPNRVNSLSTWIKNRRALPVQLSVRVWATLDPLDNAPVGALSQPAADQWIRGCTGLIPLAGSADQTLDAHQRAQVRLTPLPGALDFKQAPQLCNGLLIAVTDALTKQVQFEHRSCTCDILATTYGRRRFSMRSGDASRRPWPWKAQSMTRW